MSCTPFPAILSVLSTSHSTDIREVGTGEDAPEAPWLSVSERKHPERSHSSGPEAARTRGRSQVGM